MPEFFSYQTIDSTQNEAKRLIDAGQIKEASIILAEEQSQGRGTYGKSWASPKNAGIYTSLVLQELEQENFPYETYTQTIGHLIISVLEDYLSNLGFTETNFELKPINDIYFQGSKLAGILVERHQKFLIIGIGINLFQSPLIIKEALPGSPKAPPIALEEIIPEQVLANFDKEEFLRLLLKQIITQP